MPKTVNRLACPDTKAMTAVNRPIIIDNNRNPKAMRVPYLTIIDSVRLKNGKNEESILNFSARIRRLHA